MSAPNAARSSGAKVDENWPTHDAVPCAPAGAADVASAQIAMTGTTTFAFKGLFLSLALRHQNTSLVKAQTDTGRVPEVL